MPALRRPRGDRSLVRKIRGPTISEGPSTQRQQYKVPNTMVGLVISGTDRNCLFLVVGDSGMCACLLCRCHASMRVSAWNSWLLLCVNALFESPMLCTDIEARRKADALLRACRSHICMHEQRMLPSQCRAMLTTRPEIPDKACDLSVHLPTHLSSHLSI